MSSITSKVTVSDRQICNMLSRLNCQDKLYLVSGPRGKTGLPGYGTNIYYASNFNVPSPYPLSIPIGLLSAGNMYVTLPKTEVLLLPEILDQPIIAVSINSIKYLLFTQYDPDNFFLIPQIHGLRDPYPTRDDVWAF